MFHECINSLAYHFRLNERMRIERVKRRRFPRNRALSSISHTWIPLLSLLGKEKGESFPYVN